jgi:hypothetical protein
MKVELVAQCPAPLLAVVMSTIDPLLLVLKALEKSKES